MAARPSRNSYEIGALFVVALAFMVPSPVASNAQSILTVAGGGTIDGRPATLVSLDNPLGVAVDSKGNLYFAERTASRVRKVDAITGRISTIAGNGSAAFEGDGGPGTRASLDSPEDVAVDQDGHVLIADTFNNRIRRVDANTGVISTIAGGGLSIDDGIPAAEASIFPTSLAIGVDGRIFFTSVSGNRVRVLDPESATIHTVAGNGEAGFSGDGGPATLGALNTPLDVAVDPSGSLLIADSQNLRIRAVSLSSGVITTIAGSGERGFSGDGGPATLAMFDGPTSVSLGPTGNVYVADHINERVRLIDSQSGVIRTVAGAEFLQCIFDEPAPANQACLTFPDRIAVDHMGNLFISAETGDRVRRVDHATGRIKTYAGGGMGGVDLNGPASQLGLDAPSGVVLDHDGDLLIADKLNNRVLRVDRDTGAVSLVAGREFCLCEPGDGGPATEALVRGPTGLALGSDGSILVAEDSRVRHIDATGTITTVAGDGSISFGGDGGPATEASLLFAQGIALDQQGNLYVADSFNNRVRRVDASTGIITTFAGNGEAKFAGDGGPATEASLNWPYGLAVGPLDEIFIADRRNHRIRKVDPGTGAITTVAGGRTSGPSGDGGPATEALIWAPWDVKLASDGSLIIAEGGVPRIRKVDATSGVITTISGTGDDGFSGDAGPAVAARLGLPSKIHVDTNGDIFFSDSSNNRVRAIFACRNLGELNQLQPSDGASGLETSALLRWTNSDAAFRYDVYLDTIDPPGKLLVSGLATTQHVASNLMPLTKYYWKVVATGDPYCAQTHTIESDVRTFTTANTCDAPSEFQ